MANSTTQLSSILSWLKSFPDIAPVVQQAVGGADLQPFLTIATDTMIELISKNYNWRWNRFTIPVFYTNGFQQDYATNTVNLGWIEHGVLIDINNTAIPKPIWPLEIVRDLPETFSQFGRPGQVCWIPNNQLYYATWGASNTGNSTRGLNPGPNMAISTPLGVYSAPINPILQIQDPNGNFWMVTGYGTTGSVQPTWPTSGITYPTATNPTQAATTVTDGTVTWTAVNPNGFGIRCNPLPPQTGIVYQFYLIGQYRAFAFSNGPYSALNQTIEPIPDDFAKWFRDGCLAYAYRHGPAPMQQKFTAAFALWQKSLKDMTKQADRERDEAGFYPANPIMDGGGVPYPGPAYPFPLPWA